ncbi:MAG TPA: hypothetical protein VLM17_08630 [Xanthomonadaceae bacterium]|nr:hypothetical protein [Xanthomonadaceae bacterium]
MESWREELVTLKAQLAVQHMALRALVHSHPRPAKVLDEWRKLRADTVAAAYAPSTDVRDSEWLTEQVHSLAATWMAELASAVQRHAERHDVEAGPDALA